MVKNQKDRNLIWIVYILLGLLMIVMIPIMYSQVKNSFSEENKCLAEESYYYRIEGGFFTNKVETTKENADGMDWRCTRWEDEPSLAKSMSGQKMVHEKGTLGGKG